MNLSSRDARTIALECGVQNFAFTMVMITLSFGTGDDADDALLFPVMYGIACESLFVDIMMTFLQNVC
jgi:predicted Na+-dependent transporter